MVNALRIHPDDNVAVALRDLPAGTRLSFAGQDGAPEVATRDDPLWAQDRPLHHRPGGGGA